MPKKLTTEEFVLKAKSVHGDKYDYSKVNYIGNKFNVIIICPEHNEFSQRSNHHLSGHGCSKCYNKNSRNKNIIFEFNKIHGDKYDYSKVEYLAKQKKVKIICPIHKEFEQRPDAHLKGYGCYKCSKIKKINNKEFIEKCSKIHGDKYDYSLVKYTNSYTKVKIICPKHGEFEQAPKSHINGHGCSVCKESNGEKEVRKFLIENSIKYIYQKTFKNCKDKRVLPFDFYLPDYNMCIEYDGLQHFSAVGWFGGKDKLVQTKIKDNIRNKFCDDNKINLIRISYKDDIRKVMNNILKIN